MLARTVRFSRNVVLRRGDGENWLFLSQDRLEKPVQSLTHVASARRSSESASVHRALTAVIWLMIAHAPSATSVVMELTIRRVAVRSATSVNSSSTEMQKAFRLPASAIVIIAARF